MSINNHARKTLLVTFKGEDLVENSITLTDLGDIVTSENTSGGYANLTDIQDDIVVIRKFAGNYLTTAGADYGRGPTADEAWNAWTYPYSAADGVTTDGTSGSKMYSINDGATDINLQLTFTTDDLTFVIDAETSVRLPAITDNDIFYVIRKTKSNNKLVTFEPSARITANNLNTALDQSFFLGQEAEMWFQNYHNISPAIGQPGGIATLDANGLIPNEFLGGHRLSRADAISSWDSLGYTIKDLPDPAANADAANKHYVDAQAQYGGVLTPQQVEFAITAAGTHTAGTDKTYTPGPTWYQTDEDFFIVSIDGVLQLPNTDFEIPSDGTTNRIQIKGTTNVGDVISVRNIGRTGINQLDSATVTSTGSTAGRSLEDRFADEYNILDFAVDGYTPSTALETETTIDASPTWNAAIDGIVAAGGGTLFIPRGFYHFTTRPREVDGGVSINIKGEGTRTELVKRYSETGTGTYSNSVEGVYRGLISIYDKQNTNCFIRDISLRNAVSPNREDGTGPRDGYIDDHTGDGSAISIVARTNTAPGQIWISNVHCSGVGAGTDNRWDDPRTSTASPIPCYTYWKCGLYCDGSNATYPAQGIRGVYVDSCVFFTCADAAFKAVGVNHYVVTNSEANVGRNSVGGNDIEDWEVCTGAKIYGGTTPISGESPIDSHRPLFANCDFQSTYGIEIGNYDIDGTIGYVRMAGYSGTVGQITLGPGAVKPMIVGPQNNRRFINLPNENYTLLTSGVWGDDPQEQYDGLPTAQDRYSHSHIYGGLRLRGQGLTVGNIRNTNALGNEVVYIADEGDLALYGKLDIRKSATPPVVLADTVRIFSDAAASINHGNLFARFNTGEIVPIAREDGYGTQVLATDELLNTQPQNQSYWIDENHEDAPPASPDCSWWLVDIYSNSLHPTRRYYTAKGVDAGSVGTPTEYYGHQADDGILTWTLISGGSVEDKMYTITNPTTDRAFDTNNLITFSSNPPTPASTQTIANGSAPTVAETGQFIANMEARVGELADVLGTLISDLRDLGIVGITV